MLRSLTRILIPAAAVIASATGLRAQCQSVQVPAWTPAFWAPGLMFDVVNTSNQPLRVTDLQQVFVSSATTDIELYTRIGTWQGSETTPSAWTSLGSASVPHGASAFTPLPIPIDVAIAPGATQAFFVMTPSQLFADSLASHLGQNQLGTTIAGDGTLEIRCGIAKTDGFNVSWGLPYDGFLWRGRVQYCRVATNETIGAGCGAVFDSCYQYFVNGAQASPFLSGNVLHLHPTAQGYTGTWSAGTASALYVTPPAGGTELTSGDDQYMVITPTTPLPTPYGPQSVLAASVNGILAFANSATPTYWPLPQTFLQHPQGGIYAWHDYLIAAPGRLSAHESGQVLYVTWQGVEDFYSHHNFLNNSSTMQFQLDLATGDIALVFVSIESSPFGVPGSQHLIGVSAPGASNDPGSVNLATATLVTASPESSALSLTALSTPIQDTNWQLRIGDLPSISALGVTVIGFADAGIDDLVAIGMPNCGLRATLDLVSAFVPSPGATHYDWSLYVPDDTALLGVDVFATSAIATNPPTNAFGFVTSNGIRGTVGYY